MNNKKNTFNLIGILIIISIIGVFGSMIISSISLHKNARFIAKTRIQFIEYESALKAYCREYGEMPHFLGTEELVWLNTEGNSELLIKALSGKNPDGSLLSNKDREFLNPLGKRFYTFSDQDFFKNTDGSIDRTKLADAFNNPNICVIVEDTMDNDVIIHKSCFPKIVQDHIKEDSLDKQVAIFSVSDDHKTIIVNWIDK